MSVSSAASLSPSPQLRATGQAIIPCRLCRERSVCAGTMQHVSHGLVKKLLRQESKDQTAGRSLSHTRTHAHARTHTLLTHTYVNWAGKKAGVYVYALNHMYAHT